MATCDAIYDTFPSKYSRFASQELSGTCTRSYTLFSMLSLSLSTPSPPSTWPDNCSLDPKTDLSFSPCANFDEFATSKEMPIAVKDINCADSEKCCNATSNPTASPIPSLFTGCYVPVMYAAKYFLARDINKINNNNSAKRS